MKRKPFGILCHAFKMVGRNFRSYAMLSVTIILSFSILLGFMGYMDTEHYNRYKSLFARDRGILRVWRMGLNASSANRLQEKAQEYGTTHSLQYLKYKGCILDTSQLALSGGERIQRIRVVTYAVPRGCWYLEQNKDVFQTGSELQESYQVTWLDGREDPSITLEKGQILMDEQLFQAYGLSAENRTLELRLIHGEADFSGTFTVVGTVPSDSPLEFEIIKDTKTGNAYAKPANENSESILVFSLEDVSQETLGSGYHRTVIFHTDQPENVQKLIQSLEPELHVTSIYELQNNAMEKIRTEKGTKAIIAALLVLILGINLYSCFENALNDRKFEIGVKRAMGASGFSIIRQFFYESMIVMLVNIAISVALVVDVGIVLKCYYEANYMQRITENMVKIATHHIDYILYITPYSVGMFAVCAIVLTVVFSFVFAYKTTQVQIVDYLKAE